MLATLPPFDTVSVPLLGVDCEDASGDLLVAAGHGRAAHGAARVHEDPAAVVDECTDDLAVHVLFAAAVHGRRVGAATGQYDLVAGAVETGAVRYAAIGDIL